MVRKKRCCECGVIYPNTPSYFGPTPGGRLKGYCLQCETTLQRGRVPAKIVKPGPKDFKPLIGGNSKPKHHLSPPTPVKDKETFGYAKVHFNKRIKPHVDSHGDGFTIREMRDAINLDHSTVYKICEDLVTLGMLFKVKGYRGINVYYVYQFNLPRDSPQKKGSVREVEV